MICPIMTAGLLANSALMGVKTPITKGAELTVSSSVGCMDVQCPVWDIPHQRCGLFNWSDK